MCAVLACSKEEPEPEGEPERPEVVSRDVAAASEPEDDASVASNPPTFLHSSSRCGNCHGAMHAEWSESAHARSATSRTFLQFAAHSSGDRCARCHRPLGEHTESKRIADEGVTCDVCHTIVSVAPSESGSSFVMNTSGRTRFGPFCDLEDHYFHRMGCSPLHESSQLCAACHQWRREIPGRGSLPVFTTYSDWRESGYAAGGVQCQDCHMPTRKASIAEGAPVRANVARHGFLGEKDSLRLEAVSLSVLARSRGSAIRTEITIANRGAGHFVPTGLPARRLFLRVVALDADGRRIDSEERSLGRVLVDENGGIAPFFHAVEVREDSRVPPRGKRSVQVEVEGGERGTVRVSLFWRPIAAAIASRLEMARPPDVLLSQAEVPYGPLRGKSRRGLPRRVRVRR